MLFPVEKGGRKRGFEYFLAFTDRVEMLLFIFGFTQKTLIKIINILHHYINTKHSLTNNKHF